LDPALSEGIVRLLLDLATQHRKTLCVSLHNVLLALEYFPRVLALQQGRLVFDGKPQELSRTALQDIFADTSARPSPEDEVHARPHVAFGSRFPA
jgi:phosphonate transport system ATP-binding protein